ncbi:helix-turn-helix domain-containing protein [Algoriphagus pacificus]|uniref:Helix-turn-helix domain-containing protein n=1 Tax=Algoriphagus pacificus TaxID=2811234 RepID=A0ABS3CPD2_9BACT|nr:helix-turn-helix domain-containing protein [Algoriphagus pacificus]MBN7818026.1 helix-turn-helix domain-containing protein [Algoriphagus pacificus]
MAVEIVTKDDLEEFKTELFGELAKLFKPVQDLEGGKRWLKTYEVKKLLDISSGTLQSLRINGEIPYTKMGGILYYDRQEINRILEERKHRIRNVKF